MTIAPGPNAALGDEVTDDRLSNHLKNRIFGAGDATAMYCSSERLCGSKVLPRFYGQRAYRPGWFDNGRPTPGLFALIEVLERSFEEGLNPRDYHLETIQSLLHNQQTGTQWLGADLEGQVVTDLELLLTDAFLLYGSHLSAGRVNPETIESEWHIKGREVDLVAVLQNALSTGRVGHSLTALRPSHPGYERLKGMLADQRRIVQNGGWPQVPAGPLLALGDHGRRTAGVRRRLVLSGDLSPGTDDDPGASRFDEPLDQAVRRFQVRHGLKVDGVVGPATLQALNVTASGRLGQILLNLERWRWLPRRFGDRYILVNAASFNLDVIEHQQAVLNMPVIVGRRYRHTPVFSGLMTYLEINPFWHIPTRIAKLDLLPKIKTNPTYVLENHIRIFEGWQNDAPEVQPATIDWQSMSARDFNFKLRQDPGPLNPLGRIKFMFPNKFAVYLHDTPSKQLFAQNRRSFSSGCIRIGKPIELAAYVLKDGPLAGRQDIEAAIATLETRIVKLPVPIAIYLLYWTAWTDEEGGLHFREDIYRRDPPLYRALTDPPPA